MMKKVGVCGALVALVAFTTLSLGGCFFDPAGVPGFNKEGDASLPLDGSKNSDAAVYPDGYIWLDAAPDGSSPDPDGAIPDAAMPDASPLCDEASCPLGCTSPTGRCRRLDPTNFNVTGFYDSITGGLSVGSGEVVVVDTDNGEIDGSVTYRSAGSLDDTVNGIYFNTVSQIGGPELAVFGVTTLDLPANASLVIVGSHPVAFYVKGDASIAGLIDARASGAQPGPGGGNGGAANGDDGETCGSGSQGRGGDEDYLEPWESGGGGGGNGGSGGRGGNIINNYVSGGAAGLPRTSPSLSPLVAGCGGGAGGGPDPFGNDENGGDGGYGGGGGGGVQISCNSTLTLSGGGGIDVAGAGGQGGNYGGGGGGGGSGGSVLLEAVAIQNGGLIAANGGGGGAGGENTSHPVSENGDDGRFASTRAPGGTGYYNTAQTCSGVACYGGDGGDGGAGALVSGVRGQDNVPNAGGGGGGAGIIVFRYEETLVQGSSSPSNVQTSQGLSTW